jgi:hypothetical protein
MANGNDLELKLSIDDIPVLISSERWRKETVLLQGYAQETALGRVNSKLDEYGKQYDEFHATLRSYRRDTSRYLKSPTDDNSSALLRCKAKVDSQFVALRDTVKALQINLATFANDMARKQQTAVKDDPDVSDLSLALSKAATTFATLKQNRGLDVDIEKFHVDHSADLASFRAPLVTSPPRSGSRTPTDPTTPTDSTRSKTPTREEPGKFRNPRQQP